MLVVINLRFFFVKYHYLPERSHFVVLPIVSIFTNYLVLVQSLPVFPFTEEKVYYPVKYGPQASFLYESAAAVVVLIF
jgi:hypothetical protein